MKEKTEFPGEVYAFTEEAKQILKALVEERAHDRECFSDRGPIHGCWTLEVRPFKVDGTDCDMQDKVMRYFLNAKAHSRENVICGKLQLYCKGQSLGIETSTEKESENNADDRQESLCFWKRP